MASTPSQTPPTLPLESPTPPSGSPPSPVKACAPAGFDVRALLTAGALCVSWMVVSTGLILINNYAMRNLHFRYPMSLSTLGQAFSAVAAYVCCKVLRVVPMKAEELVDLRFFFTRILPVGLWAASTLAFGNSVYLYLTVALIQMLKAFTPCVTLAITFAFGLEVPSCQLVVSVVVICVGVAFASYAATDVSYFGLLLMLGAESTEAMKLVSMQKYLQKSDSFPGFHPIEGMMYFSASCVLWMLPGIVLKEVPQMVADGAGRIILANPLVFASAACLGFLITVLVLGVVKRFSGVAFKVLGQAKNAGTVYLGHLIWGEVVNVQQLAGYGVALAGVLWYTWLKSRPAPVRDRVAKSPPVEMRAAVDVLPASSPLHTATAPALHTAAGAAASRSSPDVDPPLQGRPA